MRSISMSKAGKEERMLTYDDNLFNILGQ